MILLEALAHDNTVLECNLRDYDEALKLTLDEIRRLKAEEASIEGASDQVDRLSGLLGREVEARERLQEENEALSARNAELKAALQAAAGPLTAKREEDALSLVEGLARENDMLRSLLFGNGESEAAPGAFAADAGQQAAHPTAHLAAGPPPAA